MKNNIQKGTKGITLIALVITIIVLLILAGVTISQLTGSDSAPAKANEAKQKQDIGAARDQVYLFATNAQTEAYEEYYVKSGTTTAGAASTNVSNFVKDEIKKEYASEKNKKVGLASIVASSDGSEVTISTTDFEVTGEIAEKGGNLTWGEVEALVPGLSLKTTSLNLAPGEEGTINYKVRGLSGNVTWTSSNSKVTVTNGVVAVANDAEEGTATITATIGEYTKTCPVTIEIKTGIILRPSSLTLEPGGSNTITADLRGVTGSVTWTKTSDADSVIVTMNDSVTNKLTITASDVNEGTATITASITVEEITYTKACTITVREEPIPIGTISDTSHEEHVLETYMGTNFSWSNLKKIAKSIATNTYINNSTTEVTATIDSTPYTIGIGDTATVYYNGNPKTVRILGFNHDKTNGETGISFEFRDFLGDNRGINSSNTNSGGWGNSAIREALNNESGTYLPNIKDAATGGNVIAIKAVNKQCSTYNGGTTPTSDKLWLLSCSEIWSNNSSYSSYCNATEGACYAYYNKSGVSCVKNSAVWWLRSPNTDGSGDFCRVISNGSCGSGGANISRGVAPGFTI